MAELVDKIDKQNNWNLLFQVFLHDNPQYNKQKKNQMVSINISFLLDMLTVYRFTCKKTLETDGSVTLILQELPISSRYRSLDEAKHLLVKQMIEYATELYNDHYYFSLDNERIKEMPYVLKILLHNSEKLMEELEIT